MLLVREVKHQMKITAGCEKILLQDHCAATGEYFQGLQPPAPSATTAAGTVTPPRTLFGTGGSSAGGSSANNNSFVDANVAANNNSFVEVGTMLQRLDDVLNGVHPGWHGMQADNGRKLDVSMRANLSGSGDAAEVIRNSTDFLEGYRDLYLTWGPGSRNEPPAP